MADVLQRGASWLARKLKAHASHLIEYRRGNLFVPLSATVGQTLLRLTDDFGETQMIWTDRDYLLTPADLILGDVVTLPQEGDLIADATDGTTQLYQVLPYGNEPVYRLDAHTALLRVHTKGTGTE